MRKKRWIKGLLRTCSHGRYRDVGAYCNTPLVAALLIMSMVPAVAGAQTDPLSGAARLRIIALVPVATPARGLRVTVDGIVMATGLGFGAGSAYTALPAGRHHVLVADGTGAPLLDTTARLTAGQDYTYSIQGLLDGSISGVLADDDSMPVAAGRARVRFGNAIPNDLVVQARLRGGAVRFPATAFASLSRYQDVPAGTYTLEITSPDGQLLLSLPNLALNSGQVYTLFSTGLNTASTATTGAQGGTVVISSASGSQVGGLLSSSVIPQGMAMGALQVVDLVPSALVDGPLILTIDGQTAVGALGFGGVTTSIALTAGEHRLQLYRTLGGTLLTGVTVTLQKNYAATYVLQRLSGNVAGGVLFQTRPVTIAATMGSVRFSNASLVGRSLRATLTGGIVFTTTVAGGMTGYSEVPAGHISLQLSSADGGVLATVPDVIVNGGQSYTLWAVDPGGAAGAAAALQLSSAGSQFISTASPGNPAT